jgi:hypothetical protein
MISWNLLLRRASRGAEREMASNWPSAKTEGKGSQRWEGEGEEMKGKEEEEGEEGGGGERTNWCRCSSCVT